jgi:hypothetical protein
MASAQGPDVGARARGLREQRQRGGRCAPGPIFGADRVMAGRLTAVLAQQLAGGGMQQPDVHPSHWTARSRPSQPGGGA